MSITDLKGLGTKSAQALQQAGITSVDQLRELGPVQAYMRLLETGAAKPNLNFLYALAGALQNRHWASLTRHEKMHLLAELDDLQSLSKVFDGAGG